MTKMIQRQFTPMTTRMEQSQFKPKKQMQKNKFKSYPRMSKDQFAKINKNQCIPDPYDSDSYEQDLTLMEQSQFDSD